MITIDKIIEIFCIADDFYKEYELEIQKVIKSYVVVDSKQELEIVLDNQIFLNRIQLNEKIIHFLKENLNILNTDYLVQKNIGKSTYLLISQILSNA